MAVLGPSKDTRPERVVRMWLVKNGVSHRRNFKGLPGRPDFYLPVHNLAVFVDGRFWHSPTSKAKRISPFWAHKIEANVCRDRRVRSHLRLKLKISTHRIWDDQLKKMSWQLRLKSALARSIDARPDRPLSASSAAERSSRTRT